jgi:hypothetical protein
MVTLFVASVLYTTTAPLGAERQSDPSPPAHEDAPSPSLGFSRPNQPRER